MKTDLGLRMAIIHVRIDESAFVRESATESVEVLGQAGVESAHRVTVRVGVAEEYFEGAGRRKDEIGRMKNYRLRYSSGVNTVKSVFPLKCLAFQVTKYSMSGVRSASERINESKNAMRLERIF